MKKGSRLRNRSRQTVKTAFLAFAGLHLWPLFFGFSPEISIRNTSLLPPPSPNVEAILQITGVDFPASGVCGHFSIVVEGEIKNTGDAPLEQLQAIADLAAGPYLGKALIGLVEPPILLERTAMTSPPVLNAAYNGRTETRLFDGQSGRLLPGEVLALQWIVEVYPAASGAPDAPALQLVATGQPVDGQGLPLPEENGGLAVGDSSHWAGTFHGGLDDPDEPTLLGDCWRQVQSLAVRQSVNITADASCRAFLSPQLLITGFVADCSEEVYPRGGYYRVFFRGQEIREPIDVSSWLGTSQPFEIRTVVFQCAPVVGRVRFEDKTPPQVACPQPVSFACSDVDSIFNNPASLDPSSRWFTGLPEVIDNCSEQLSFTWSDELLQYGCEGGMPEGGDGQAHYAAVVRTFGALDAAGNVSPGCRQFIYFDRPPVAGPAPVVRLDFCRQSIALDERGNPHPDHAGYPYYLNARGDTMRLSGYYCDYTAAYQDLRFPGSCPGAYKVLRTWTVLDECGQPSKLVFEQTIEVGDFSAPAIQCAPPAMPGDTLTFSTGPFHCTAAFVVPAPGVSGECSSFTVKTEIFTYRRKTDPFGNPIGPEEFVKVNALIENGVASQVPVGTNYFVYTVTDACGNAAVSAPCVFKVTDKIEPVAICGDDLRVSLGGSGVARLLTTDLDKGSRDNCGPVTVRLRRELPDDCLDDYLFVVYGVSRTALREKNGVFFLNDEEVLRRENGRLYSPWAEDAFVTCCDVGTTAELELRVTDGAGNANTCAAGALVEDKIAPQCQPPPAAGADCRELAGEDLQDTLRLQERFGRAGAVDNCRAWTVELAPAIALDQCGVGTVTRRFQAVDAAGNRSAVVQQVVEVRPLNDYLLRFPADAGSTTCGRPVADTLVYNEWGCDLLAVSVEDEIFSGGADECYKILRTYRVIDWCEYDNVSGPVVIGRDEDRDGRPGDEPVFVLRRPDSVFIDNNANEQDGFLRRPDSRGYWEYTQIIKVFDRQAPVVAIEAPPVFCSRSADCTASVGLNFSVAEECSSDGLTVEVWMDRGADGTLDTRLATDAVVAQGGGRFRVTARLPLGSHRMVVRATDGCGNLAVAEERLEITDCLAPAPVCRQSLVVELSPLDTDDDGRPDSAIAVLEPSDLLTSFNTGDCSGPLLFSLNRRGEQPDTSRRRLHVSCSDLGMEVAVDVYARDRAVNPFAVQPDGSTGGANYGSCTVLVTVRDNQGACARTAALGGRIATELDSPVADVLVALSGGQTMEMPTGAGGSYAFPEILLGYDYTLTPSLNRDAANGVSTLDLVKISKHILGVTPLDSPYKIIAADANRSGNVSTLDMIQLRKLILGVSAELPESPSWRFIDRSFAFADARSPLDDDFPEFININDLAGPVETADFVGVKVGDVTGNARGDNLQAVEERGDAALPVPVLLEDREVHRNRLCRVPVTIKGLECLQGFQFTLEYDRSRLELLDIKPGMVQENMMGTFPGQGALTVSWFPFSAAPAGFSCETPGENAPPDDALLFTLLFRAETTGRLREALWLNSRITPAEAYDPHDFARPLVLQWDPAQTPAPELYQNRPNPFEESTHIGFFLPEPSEVTLRITDVNGRPLRLFRALFPAGYQAVEVSGRDLPAGVIYYTLKTAGFIQTRKMVLVR